MSNSLISLPDDAITVDAGRVFTTSLTVAEVFGKRHADVLRSIDDLRTNCPAEFSERNFAFTDYIDKNGDQRPMVELAKDGFTLLVMGYTGSKAVQFKLAYIARFNAMEAALRPAAPSRTPEDRLQEAQEARDRCQKVLTRVKGLIASTEEGEYWATESCSSTLDALCAAVEAHMEQVQAALEQATDECSTLRLRVLSGGTRRSGPALTYRP